MVERFVRDLEFLLESGDRRRRQLRDLVPHQAPQVPTHLVGRPADYGDRDPGRSVRQAQAVAGAAGAVAGASAA